MDGSDSWWSLSLADLLSTRAASIWRIDLIKRRASSVKSCFSLAIVVSHVDRVARRPMGSLLCYQLELIVQCFGKGSKQFGLARVAFVGRQANVVEEAMQLVDDGRDLVRKIAGIHVVRREQTSDVNMSMLSHVAAS